MKFNFEQDDPVKFDNGAIKGEGIIVGCSVIEQAVIGATYIVKVTDGSVPTEEYPFDTVAITECHLVWSLRHGWSKHNEVA